MFTCYCHSQLTSLTGNAAPAATDVEVTRDQSSAGTRTVMDPEVVAELAIMRGEYLTLLCTPQMTFFLAVLAAKERELQTLQDAAAGSPKDYPHIERPAKIGNLQADMHLANDDETYTSFSVSFFFLPKRTVTDLCIL
jgi:hypothetical protein